MCATFCHVIEVKFLFRYFEGPIFFLVTFKYYLMNHVACWLEKETALNKTKMVGIRQVFVDLLLFVIGAETL